MEDCHSEGISGNCGPDCRVYRRGDCDCPPQPYMLVCMDGTGVDLTEGRRYPLIRKVDGFLEVADDSGETRQFLSYRFDFEDVPV